MDPFAEIVGPEHVRSDAKSRRSASSDLFIWPRGRICRAVVSPGSAEEAARVVRAALAIGCAVVCRGSGLSCSGGYVPHEDEAIVLDLRRLNAVRELNLADQYITVEAGSTWQDISNALNGTGFRTVLPPPLLDGLSTVGGTLSAGVLQGASGVLAIEAVIGTGKLIQTGIASRAAHTPPFFRHFGPDFTGLFLGDCGTFGVKTAASLALEPVPRATAQASFAFDTLEAMMRAVVACSRLRAPGQIVGLDPARDRNAVYLACRDTVASLAQAVMDKTRLRGDLKDAYADAASRRDFLGSAQWTLHLVTEGVCEAASEEVLNEQKELCKREGREIVDLLAAAIALRRCSTQGLFGLEGERRMTMHAIVPTSAAEASATRVRQLFGLHRARMQAEQMRESYVVSAYAGAVVLEPSFCWQDELTPLQAEYAEPSDIERTVPANPHGRALAYDLGEELKALFNDIGAAQIGLDKLYAYRSILAPQLADAWDRLRHSLDPEDRLNPGNLQL